MSAPSPRDLERVRALVALAVSPATGHSEAAAAALQAVRRIHDLDLLGLERSHALRQEAAVEAENLAREQYQADQAFFARQQARSSLVRVDVLLLLMSESAQAYRFARLGPSFRTTGMPVVGWMKKRFVARVVWAGEEVARRYASTGRRVVEALLVPEEHVAVIQGILLRGGER